MWFVEGIGFVEVWMRLKVYLIEVFVRKVEAWWA
jgi:hypothetical protein